MSKPVEKSKPVRMFIALDLPEMVREDIVRWGEVELTDPALRRVPPESLHVTLAFLGNRPLDDVERLAEAMEEAADRPVLLELGGPVGRPAGNRPRLVALPVLHGPVPGLWERLCEILSFEGLYDEPEERPFWPHVTVARIRAEGRGSRRPMRVEIPPGPSPTERIGWFDGVRISLYRSELQPSGARYVPLAQVELPGAGWQ
ncbi:MAG TPA: RNA 2',3'-cyclic phosphodiesterase [Solirubrobacterales bacterium]|nr:RNA 2',3'-cyclic phosphodiesterase [Solirubrobacterales bacterium]